MRGRTFHMTIRVGLLKGLTDPRIVDHTIGT